MGVRKRTKTAGGSRRARWEAEVYSAGVRVEFKCFDTAAAAHDWHEKTARRYRSGAAFAKTAREMTLADVFKKYEVASVSMLRRQSIQSREARYPHFYESPIAATKMEELTDRTISRWLDWILEQPTAKSARRKTFDHEMTILTIVLNWYREEYDPTFVVPITRRHRKRCRYKLVPPRRPDYFMPPHETRAWLEWLRAHHPKPVFFDLALFSVATATRIGEAAGLFWEDVDLERGVARIVQTCVWDHKTRQPELQAAAKTVGSIRIVILPPVVTGMLIARRGLRDLRGPIFVGNDGWLLNYRAIAYAFDRGFRALKMPWRATRILRHTWATNALIATRDLTAVQANLGHTKAATTQIYAKTIARLDSGATRTTADHLGLDLVWSTGSRAESRAAVTETEIMQEVSKV